MNDCILEMKSITKEYPGVKALDNVNLQVRRGEIHALVGENGAGKSTTKEKQLWAISIGLKLTALLEKK